MLCPPMTTEWTQMAAAKKSTMLTCPGRWPWYGQGDRCPKIRDNNVITTWHNDEAQLLSNHEEMPNDSQDTPIDQRIVRQRRWQMAAKILVKKGRPER